MEGALTVRGSRFWKRWIEPVFLIKNLLLAPRAYWRYFSARRRYQRTPGAEALHWRDSFPQLFDAVRSAPFDAHYFYQAVWATERIARTKPARHIDVGSHIPFVGMLTTHVPVVFADLRLLRARLPRLLPVSADILALPFGSGSLQSLSCLHVVEHIGLGRYGDPLNPAGTRLACSELARVLAPGGNLYISMPVGRPRVCFNAHRIHSPAQILDYFHGLQLVEFSAVDDDGTLLINADCERLERASYGCGLFWFRR